MPNDYVRPIEPLIAIVYALEKRIFQD